MTSSYSVNASVSTLDALRENATFAANQLAQWENNQTGEYALPSSNQFGWLRLPENASIFQTVQDPSAGPTSGHYELIFSVSLIPSNLSILFLKCLLNRINSCPSLRLSRPPAISFLYTLI